MSKKKFNVSKKELEKLIKSGSSYQNIAQMYGVSVGSVTHALKREGLHIPARPTRRALVTVRLVAEELKLLDELRKKYGATSKGQAIREAIGKAAIAAKLVPDDYRPPR